MVLTEDSPLARIRGLASRLAPRMWMIPAGWCVLAIGLGLAVPRIDSLHDASVPLGFVGGTEGARTVLSTIAGAMISVTGVVFSVTMVVLQLASSQFSPRVLETFLADRVVQNTLGLFIATFMYSLIVLRSILEDGPIPQTAVTLAYVFVLAAVAMFVFFMGRITRNISVRTVVHRVASETRELIERRTGQPEGVQPIHTDAGQRQSVITAGHSGYLDAVYADRLVSTASDHDAHVEVVHSLGTFVVEGTPVAVVRQAAEDAHDWSDLEQKMGRMIIVRRQRTMEQDISYGFRRLVDIAERAISPGINDPTTATQVIDEMHDLLRRLALAPEPQRRHGDSEGRERVLVRPHTFADLLDQGVDEIAHWGATGLQVPRRLLAMLDELIAAAPHHLEVLRAKRAAVNARVERASGTV